LGSGRKKNSRESKEEEENEKAVREEASEYEKVYAFGIEGKIRENK